MFKRLIQAIKQNNHFVFTFISVLAAIFWYLNFSFLTNLLLLNLLFLFVYFFLNSLWLGKILSHYGFEKEIRFIFGVFCLFYLIAFGMAIPIVLYKITPIYLFGWLTSLTIVISLVARNKKENDESLKIIENKDNFLKPNKIKIVCFIWGIITVFCLFLLFYSRTGKYINSPWAVIHPFYIYGWLVLGFILFSLAFSNLKLKKFLLIAIVSSLLMHAYLLIPYQTGFGGDKWRHIGAEKWLMEGKIYSPAIFGEEISYQQIGPLKIPEVFVAGNKTSYANMWGAAIAVSWLTGLDIFYVDLILGVLLFSLFSSFLLLKIGLFFSAKREFLYLLILMPFLFYPLQSYGSIMMPLAFSFLPFLFAMIFALKYFNERGSFKKILLLLLVFIPILYLNYLVYLILFLELLALMLFLKSIKEEKQKGKKIKVIFLAVLFLILLVFIPLLQTYNQYSWFKEGVNFEKDVIGNLKDFTTRLISSKAIFPRFNQMEQDSWLYATLGEEFSARQAFLTVLPWSLILTILVWIFVIFGFIGYKKLNQPKIGLLFLFLLISVLINQMLSTYLQDGNYLLTKRLVVFNSFLMFVPLSWGLVCLREKIGKKNISLKNLTVFFILFLSLLMVTVYASGPKFQVVTSDELASVKYIWEQLKQKSDRDYCVLANTWPLLALEGVSGRQVVTGGFPFYYEYRQPERTQLFENMNNQPSVRYLKKSLEITKADECYFMTEKRWLYFDRKQTIINQLDQWLGQHKEIGDVLIWKYETEEIKDKI